MKRAVMASFRIQPVIMNFIRNEMSRVINIRCTNVICCTINCKSVRHKNRNKDRFLLVAHHFSVFKDTLYKGCEIIKSSILPKKINTLKLNFQ